MSVVQGNGLKCEANEKAERGDFTNQRLLQPPSVGRQSPPADCTVTVS